MIRLSAYMIVGFLTMTIAQLIEAIYLGIVGTAAFSDITNGNVKAIAASSAVPTMPR